MANIRVLVVGGGGGAYSSENIDGGNSAGGAGGYIYNESYSINPGQYAVQVGNGGGYNQNGQNSVFNDLIAYGGGKGGFFEGGNGGSGGGSCYQYMPETYTYTGGLGIAGQGNNGAIGSIYTPENIGYGGPGGGAGGAPVSPCSSTGPSSGGPGLSNTILDDTVRWYAGGGGNNRNGTMDQNSSGSGGIGGGGAGALNFMSGPTYIPQDASIISSWSGQPNTGGGSGAYNRVWDQNGPWTGFDPNLHGGSGIVVVRYKTSDFPESSGGTITTIGTDTVHAFYDVGSFTLLLGASMSNSGFFEII